MSTFFITYTHTLEAMINLIWLVLSMWMSASWQVLFVTMAGDVATISGQSAVIVTYLSAMEEN